MYYCMQGTKGEEGTPGGDGIPGLPVSERVCSQNVSRVQSDHVCIMTS